MKNWKEYHEATANNRIAKEEIIDGIIYRIESETEYDVINWDDEYLTVINRNGSDEETHDVEHFDTDIETVIDYINNL